jgi:hypothetical protein
MVAACLTSVTVITGAGEGCRKIYESGFSSSAGAAGTQARQKRRTIPMVSIRVFTIISINSPVGRGQKGRPVHPYQHRAL